MEQTMKWFTPGRPPFALAGFPFFDRDAVYRRLPLNPPQPLPESVEHLANQTAGGQIRFRARLKKLALQVSLRDAGGMYHMTATGQSGFDCYVSEQGEPVYYSTVSFTPGDIHYTGVLLDLPEALDMNILINFPLYQGVDKVLLGFNADAELSSPAPFGTRDRIVVYGGSIDQGGCANRPGMAYSNILSRWLNTEFVNLGFSGSGMAEAEVALAVREIERVGMFIINTAGNCPTVEWLADHLPIFIALLRERYPETPILIYSLAQFARSRFSPEARALHSGKIEVERALVAARQAAGDRHIHYCCCTYEYEFEGHSIYFENTVDGVHPTDLGFFQMAKELYREIGRILPRP